MVSHLIWSHGLEGLLASACHLNPSPATSPIPWSPCALNFSLFWNAQSLLDLKTLHLSRVFHRSLHFWLLVTHYSALIRSLPRDVTKRSPHIALLSPGLHNTSQTLSIHLFTCLSSVSAIAPQTLSSMRQRLFSLYHHFFQSLGEQGYQGADSLYEYIIRCRDKFWSVYIFPNYWRTLFWQNERMLKQGSADITYILTF